MSDPLEIEKRRLKEEILHSVDILIEDLKDFKEFIKAGHYYEESLDLFDQGFWKIDEALDKCYAFIKIENVSIDSNNNDEEDKRSNNERSS